MVLLDSVDFNKDKLRNKYLSEMMYFASNPQTAGMMTEDGRIILRDGMPEDARNSVYQNELARLHMSSNPPKFNLTDEQKKFLSGTSYANANDGERNATIAARILSGDPSAQNPSFEQDVYARNLKRIIGGGF